MAGKGLEEELSSKSMYRAPTVVWDRWSSFLLAWNVNCLCLLVRLRAVTPVGNEGMLVFHLCRAVVGPDIVESVSSVVVVESLSLTATRITPPDGPETKLACTRFVILARIASDADECSGRKCCVPTSCLIAALNHIVVYPYFAWLPLASHEPPWFHAPANYVREVRLG